MDIRHIEDSGLGNSSYVVDLGDGGALIVDPQRDPRPYLAELDQLSLRPRFVVETHLHADFVSGGAEMAAAGADLWAPAGAQVAYPHRSLRDREEHDLGGMTLQVIATPGHTPEHLAYLLLDGPTPLALFSGGTLMAGGVARTDLISPDQTEPLARAAYRSIRDRLLVLPDDLPVFPTHGGGSFCATGADGEQTTTIGQEKIANPLLMGETDEDTFVERLLGGYGTYPPYFQELREVNRQGVEVYGQVPPPLRQLSVVEVEANLADGAELVDIRSVDAFAAGHVPGSLSIPWRSQFATWLGWMVPLDRPVVFIADTKVDRDDLVWSALTIGFERLVGELEGGIEAWQSAGRGLGQVQLVEDDAGRQVLDVRQSDEWAAGHLPGAVHAEMGSLPDDSVESTESLLVHCGHGQRAMTAASILVRNGHDDVAVFAGSPRRLGSLITD